MLEKRMMQIPPAPTDIADVMLAVEIRAHVARQTSPIDFALKSVSNARVLGALSHASAALSGLTDDQLALVRSRAREALHLEQTALQQKLTSALGELKKGLGAAKRLIFERCELREDSDGRFHSTRKPLLGNGRWLLRTEHAAGFTS
jgi:hypothetical protein